MVFEARYQTCAVENFFSVAFEKKKKMEFCFLF